MKLPRFTLIPSNPIDLPGAGYILDGQDPPYHFARIVKYGNMSEFGTGKKPLIYEQVEGYNIVISLAGSMEGKVHFSAYGPAKLQQLIKDMTEWFTNRYADKQEYKKYRL